MSSLLEFKKAHKEYIDEMMTKYRRGVPFTTWLVNKGYLKRRLPTDFKGIN